MIMKTHTAGAKRQESRFLQDWRQPNRTSPPTSPSPPTTRPTTPSWRSPSDDSRSRSSSESSSSSSNWRTGSPPRPIRKQAGLPPPDELMEGDIVYLTPKRIPDSSIIRSHVNQSGFEDHPIVVLGKERRKGTMIVSFRLLTTFNGHTVEEKRQGDRRYQRKFFMMVDNHQDRVNSTINPVAKMAPGFDPLKRRSYVNLSPNSRFEVEYEYLEAFGKDPLRRLDAGSVSYIKSARSDT